MNESHLVIETIQELNRRECNGHVKLRIGSALINADRFRNIFRRFSAGTYFEDVRLDIDEIPIVVSCGCGYRRRVGPKGYLYKDSCPRCGAPLAIEKGNEFEIVEPSNS